MRVTSKLASNHPAFSPTITLTSAAATLKLSSTASGTSPVLLSVPQSSDLYGRRFTIHFAGQFVISTPASPAALSAQIGFVKQDGTTVPLHTMTITPAGSQTNTIYVLNARFQLAYDAGKKLLTLWYDNGYFGNTVQQVSFGSGLATSYVGLPLTDFNFYAAVVTLTNTVTSGTFVPYEFVLA